MTGLTKLDEKLEKIKLEDLPEIDTDLLRKAIAKTAMLDLCKAILAKNPKKWNKNLGGYPEKEEKEIIKFIMSPYGQQICEGTILENASEKKIKYISVKRGLKMYGKNMTKGEEYKREEAEEIVEKLKKEYLEELEQKRKKYDPHELEKKIAKMRKEKKNEEQRKIHK